MAGQAFGWTQVFPGTVTLFLSVAGFVTEQFLWPFLGLYLHGAQLVLWIFQVYFNSVRPNPVCQLYHAYAFPSVPAFYVAAVIAGFVTYAYMWDVYLSWIPWLVFYLLAAFPAIMVWFQYNRWWEVLFSMGLGAAMTVVFIIVTRLYICPTLPYLLNDIPCSWLGYKDLYLMDKKQLEECRKCQNAINAVRL